MSFEAGFLLKMTDRRQNKKVSQTFVFGTQNACKEKHTH